MLQLLFFSLFGSGLACSWEWAGVFHVHETTTLIWTFEKKTISGVVKYADATMNVAIRKASTADEAGIDSVKSAAEADLAGSLTAAATGATLNANVGYTITFDTSSWMTIVKIPVVAEDNIVIFAQHGPSEFSNTLTNYMQNDHGEAMSASKTEACTEGDDHSGHAHGDDHDDHSEEATTTDRVGEVIAASLITALPTLLGIFLMFSCCPTGGDLMSFLLHYGNALAAGILLAAALFLFLPEGSHFLAVGRTEAEAAAVWGSTCIAGWLIGALSHLVGDVVKKMCMRDDTAVAVTTDGTDTNVKPERKMMWVLGIPIFCGDFCCNLADGFVLGTAFRNCSPGFAWKICGIIIAHELPQEVADIYALINKAGMKWWQATILNLACGTAALWGGLIAYYSDIPLEAEGAILVLAGGVFLYVALTELGPGAAHFFPKTTMPLISAGATMLTFIVGAASIGLILLDHEHCAEGGGHGGHGDSHGDVH